MKRLSILFFLIALLIAGVTIAAVVVRANAILAGYEPVHELTEPFTRLEAVLTTRSKVTPRGQAKRLQSRPDVRLSED